MNDADPSPFSALMQPREQLTLDIETTALFVIDLQYFDAHRDWGEGLTAQQMGVAHCFDAYFDRIDEILPNVAQLLLAFRSMQAEVAHVRVAERTADSRDVAPKQLLRGLIVPSTSKEAEFLIEVAPTEDELIFDKSSSGMFPATNVDRILRNLGMKTLVFCGTSTGGCVESAVRDAVDLGYRVVVVEDACAASTALDHAQALARMQGPNCHIAITKTVVSLLSSQPVRSRAHAAGTYRIKAFLPDPSAPRDDATDPYDLIFPPAQSVDVRSSDTALLVIDAQKLTCDPNSTLMDLANKAGTEAMAMAAYLERVKNALTSIRQLLSAAHTTGLQVIHVRTASRTRDGRDLAPTLRAIGLEAHVSSSEAKIESSLPLSESDIVVSKPGQGVFTGTGLDDLLRHLGTTKLIMMGISPLGSIEGTLRGATDRGYQVLLVPDACAAATEAGQRKLAGMEAGLIEVSTSNAVVRRIELGR